jgi:SdiA-regulated
MPVYKNTFPVLLLFIFICFSCKNKVAYKSPAGYDLTKPEKFLLNKALHEISGICFLTGNTDEVFAIEDEDGKLFRYTLANEKTGKSKFGKKGDYEDLTVLNNNFVVLKSDGSLSMFPVSAIENEKIDSGVQEYKNILPAGEYEGLTAADNKLFALCKNCPGDKGKKEVSVYTIQPDSVTGLSVTNSFKIDISMVQEEGNREKFNPSCIGKHPITKEWFIISSVNKLLVVLDEQWKVKEYYPIDPSLFNQPEGLTFNEKGDLYISNEGGNGVADILLFKYQQQ